MKDESVSVSDPDVHAPSSISTNISSTKILVNATQKNNSSCDKRKIIIISLIILAILTALSILILLEIFFNKIITLLLFTKFISIPFQIFLHFLLVRYLVIQIAFAGHCFLLMRPMIYNLGKSQAKQIFDELNKFRDNILKLTEKRETIDNLKDLDSIEKQFRSTYELISYCLAILTKMKNKFNKLTVDQQVFYENLSIFNEKFEIIQNIIPNIIKAINDNHKNSISELNDDIQNEIKNLLENELDSHSIINNIDIIMIQLYDYIGNDYKCLSKKYLKNFFYNFLFASIEQFHCELDNYFIYEEKQLKTKDNCILEYIIIKSNQYSNNKKLMIMCGPNGAPFQMFSRNVHLGNYLNDNIDVLCWNYRGYGFSKGTPNFNNLRSDILEIFDEVKSTGRYEHFAVHGISIGGVPCCHLAYHRKEIELLICDRNFGEMDFIPKNYPFGKYLYMLYKILFMQSSDNVSNYLNTNCYKIVLNDPKDGIVTEVSSLKTMVATELCKKYLVTNNFNFGEINNNKNDLNTQIYANNNIENQTLKNKDNNNQLPTINDKIIDNNINNSNNYNPNNDEITTLDKLLGLKNSKKIFIKKITDVVNIINSIDNKSNNIFSRIFKKLMKKANKYSNLNEEEIQNNISIYHLIDDELENVFAILKSAGDSLSTIYYLNSEYKKTNFIENFFNNLFIWGSIDRNTDSNTDRAIIWSTSHIKQNFDKFLLSFENFMNLPEIKSSSHLNIIKDINIIYNYFKQMRNNLQFLGITSKTGLVKLLKEKDDVNPDYEENLIMMNRGNLVNLSCGHNGALTIQEGKTFRKFFKKSKFSITKENNIEPNKNNYINNSGSDDAIINNEIDHEININDINDINSYLK